MFEHNNEEATDGQRGLIIESQFSRCLPCVNSACFSLKKLNVYPDFPHLKNVSKLKRNK